MSFDKTKPITEGLIVETRAFIEDGSAFEERLREKGATFAAEDLMKDEFFADLSEVFPTHSYERVGKAARIRHMKSPTGDVRIVAVVKEAPVEANKDKGFHDATYVAYSETSTDSYEEMVEKLNKKGFPTLLTEIKKVRRTFELDGDEISIDEIEGFGPGIEIRTAILSEDEIIRTKENQIKKLLELGVEKQDIVEKSLTHMIIDARIRRDPKVKIPMLEAQLNELEERRKELRLKVNDYVSNEGDGWHDNAAYDILTEDVNVLDVRISEIKRELMESRIQA